MQSLQAQQALFDRCQCFARLRAWFVIQRYHGAANAFGERAACSSDGRIGSTVSNADASGFNDRQIYVWIINGPADSSSAGHLLITVDDPDNPGSGDPWRFPAHTGSGTDSATLATRPIWAAAVPIPASAVPTCRAFSSVRKPWARRLVSRSSAVL